MVVTPQGGTRGLRETALSIRGEVTVSNFAGLDIGLDYTTVCIMDREGEILHEAMVPSDPDSLSQHLRETGLLFKRIGMEACPLSQWLFDGLVNGGFPAICIEIRHLKAAMSAMTHKSDRNDARGIAQVMRTGWFRSVHRSITQEEHPHSGIPPPASWARSARACRARSRLVEECRRALRRPPPAHAGKPHPHIAPRHHATRRRSVAGAARPHPLQVATAHARCHAQRHRPAAPPACHQ